MSVGIECPVCEAIFQVKQVSSTTGIRCPQCDRKFRYSKTVLAAKQTAKKTTSTRTNTEKNTPKTKQRTQPATQDLTAPSQKHSSKQNPLKKSKWKTAIEPTADPTQEKSAPNKTTSANTADLKKHPANTDTRDPSVEVTPEQANPSALSRIEARRMQKARRQTLTTVATTLILSIAMVVLGYFLYRQLNSPPPVKQTTRRTNDPAPKNPISPHELPLSLSEPQWKDSAEDQQGFDQAESDQPYEDEKPIELPRVLADDLPDREFEYLQTKELKSVWQRIRPRLIALEIRTDLGTAPSIGTIVDSRGWALTSNQLVSKWPDVTVTASARNVDDYYAHVDAQEDTAGSLLTDLSKGVASVHPKRDQTLIELNPRFVVALDTLEFAKRLDIVSGMYLIQAAPPSPTNPYGYEEVEVHGRQEFEELETEARDKAKALGIDDPLATWVVTSKKAMPIIGTPVLTRTGKLVATYAFSTKQFAYFLMADQTKNLIAQAAASSAEGGKLKVVDATVDLLSADHPMARPSQLMNLAGVACEGFGWIPNDSAQYLQLQKFTRRFSTVAQFLQDQQDDESESVSLSILSDQIKRWQRSLSQSIEDMRKIAPEKIDLLNKIAIGKLSAQRPNNANTYVPFFAKVDSVKYDSIDNQDYVFFTIGQNQAIIKAPYFPQRRMLPGSQWLCFYKRLSRPSRSQLKLNSGETVPLYSDGQILLLLGPIPNR